MIATTLIGSLIQRYEDNATFFQRRDSAPKIKKTVMAFSESASRNLNIRGGGKSVNEILFLGRNHAMMSGAHCGTAQSGCGGLLMGTGLRR
jgi:hypothetical protein